MATTLNLDFETRSECDLRAAGADVYAAHPSTDILCMAWSIDDGPVHIWRPLCGDVDPRPALDHIARGGTVRAWNTYFEESIWQHVVPRFCPGWPTLRTEQLDDTMARAYAAALPGALGMCAKALGLPQEKDTAGRNVMLQLCKPRTYVDGKAVWWTPADAPEKFERLYQYCQQDVLVEREIGRRLRPLTGYQHQTWLLDQKINRRGVRLDVDAVENARRLAASEGDRLNREMAAATAGAVTAATQVGKLKDWVRGHGLAVASLDKAGLKTLLSDKATPNAVKAALRIRREAGKTSTAKFKKMLAGISSDGRARGLFQWHGTTTGRAAGRRIQVQSLVRPKLSADEVAEAIELFGDERDGATLINVGYGPPLDVLSWSVRGMIIPEPGCEMIGGDFRNIEGRMLAWLAGEDWKLDAFREFDAGTGPDLYKLAYGRAFDIDPNSIGDDGDDRRQIGKVMELACGYQGGVGAFRSMAKNYGAELAPLARIAVAAATQDALEDAERKRQWLQVEHKQHADLPAETYLGLRIIVDAWRAAHPTIKSFWPDMDECAMSAVQHRGERFTTGSKKIVYTCGRHFLYMRLPSGRYLSYARPSLVYIDDELRGGKRLALQYWAVGKDKGKTGAKKFAPAIFYGGLGSENATQAAACDVLMDAMLRLENAGYPVVLHVHDEAQCEVPFGRGSVEDCQRIMSEVPDWAGGLPLSVECKSRVRYHK